MASTQCTVARRVAKRKPGFQHSLSLKCCILPNLQFDVAQLFFLHVANLSHKMVQFQDVYGAKITIGITQLTNGRRPLSVYQQNAISMAFRWWTQWRSQNAEKVKHIKGRLLDQAVILFNRVPFKMGTSLKGKNLLPERTNYFL